MDCHTVINLSSGPALGDHPQQNNHDNASTRACQHANVRRSALAAAGHHSRSSLQGPVGAGASVAEDLVKELFAGLTDNQKKAVVKPWNHPARKSVNPNRALDKTNRSRGETATNPLQFKAAAIPRGRRR